MHRHHRRLDRLLRDHGLRLQHRGGHLAVVDAGGRYLATVSNTPGAGEVSVDQTLHVLVRRGALPATARRRP